MTGYKKYANADALLKRAFLMMFRIYDEQVPLFSSDRLRNLHKECGVMVEDINKYFNNKQTELHDDPDLQGRI